MARHVTAATAPVAAGLARVRRSFGEALVSPLFGAAIGIGVAPGLIRTREQPSACDRTVRLGRSCHLTRGCHRLARNVRLPWTDSRRLGDSPDLDWPVGAAPGELH